MSSLAVDYSSDMVKGGTAAQAAFGSIADIANQTFDGFERLTRLNLETVKSTLDEQHGIALEAVDSRSFDWFVTLPSAQAQAGFKKALSYWQQLSEIATETAANNAGAGWEGLSACTRWLASTYSDATRAPTGSALVLSSPDANLPTPVEPEIDLPVRAGGKKRSLDFGDGTGNVASSAKQ